MALIDDRPAVAEMHLTMTRDGWRLLSGDLPLLSMTGSGAPIAVGTGRPTIRMFRGNFDIQDQPTRIALAHARRDGDRMLLSENEGTPPLLALRAADPGAADAAFELEALDPAIDRLWLRLDGAADEAFWGGGEQMSYFNLAGRRFPIWTSEPGVGRDKSDPFTRAMDEAGMAGGDYWTSNYPQPTYLSSRGYALHLDTSAYSVLDFSDPAAPMLEAWTGKLRVELWHGPSPATLVSKLSTRFGRQPPLPDWAIGGAIVGLKDGANSLARLDTILGSGAAVSGLWCEDWAGIRQTSFGRRLFWNWRWNPSRYPDLPAVIADLKARGIRFLAYANPYLAVDGDQYEAARQLGHLALEMDSDEPYRVDFGEFDAGVVDFTSEAACAWFAEAILGREMLDIGIDGWMADFGEYLPIDCRLASGEPAMLAHNRWPLLWAKVNDRALASRNRRGDALFFMRAGAAGFQAHCPLLWAGDQSVDFSRHDGINTVITGALSSGLMGMAYSHSDLGGYTSLGGKVRSAELVRRWCELAAFAPVMRSHEGNRPDDNLQIDSDPDLLAAFARWSRVHAALAPYVRTLCDEATRTGLPAMRALFLHYPDDRETFDLQDQYLYGEDLLVAPVVEEGAVHRRVYLPGDQPWRYLWSNSDMGPGWVEVDAPLDRPPLFVRPGSAHAALFDSLPALVIGAAP